MPKRKSKTAAELMAELANDQQYQRQAEDRDRRFTERERELSAAEEALVRDLGAAGVRVSTVWDLVNTSEEYGVAVPILRRYLDHPTPKVREGVARALTIRGLDETTWATLRDRFVNETNFQAKWAIANALGTNITDVTRADATNLVLGTEHGECRLPLIQGLAYDGHASTSEVLRSLRDDPEIGAEVGRILEYYEFGTDQTTQ